MREKTCCAYILYSYFFLAILKRKKKTNSTMHLLKYAFETLFDEQILLFLIMLLTINKIEMLE